VYEKRGFRNHVMNCVKPATSKSNKLTPMQAMQQIATIVWRFDYTYLFPRPDMLSMLYYILVVYPLLYVFVWRMCV